MQEKQLLTEAERELLAKQAHHYFMEEGCSCGLTMLHCLSELFSLPLTEQVYDAMNGALENRDFRDQCGLYKGTLMFIGIYGAAHGWQRPQINSVTMDFAEKMLADFGSLKCYDLRGGKFLPTEPHDKCAPLVERAVIYSANYLRGLA